ncbi:putative invertase inhibitor [Chenopodium quinoa]|uniref:Pectinesterase inhibitor domain-containing protein n=1 Tax=Chenopodium quinoa TaxID=63459 RepID=A0A803M8R3_CHEQI|nr:putative invertase inhibitor [Chenopodium quinoa]
MKTMNSPYILFFTLVLFFNAIKASNLINQTCKNSSKNDPNINYKFCVYALQSAPASHCANTTRLGLISITLIKHNVTDTRCSIKQLLQDKKVSKRYKGVLKDCLELYSDALSTLSEVVSDFRAQRFVDANVKVSSVMEASTTCEDGFEEVGVSPLTQENNRIFQLSAVALSIMNILHSSEN